MNNKHFPASASAASRARPPVSIHSCIYNAFQFGVIAAAAVLASGCATHYKFAVEAVNQTDGALPPQSYRLVDARPASDAGDALFARVARDVRTALSSKGLYPAPEGVSPGILIEVDFGISAPIVTQHVRTRPVYATMPPSPSLPRKYGGNLDETDPLPKFVDNVEEPFTVTTYEKFLRLTARENRDADAFAHRQVWSLYITNKDESDDLPEYARLMVAAAMDDITGDIHPGRRTVLTRNDGRVVFIEKGLDPAPRFGSL